MNSHSQNDSNIGDISNNGNKPLGGHPVAELTQSLLENPIVQGAKPFPSTSAPLFVASFLLDEQCRPLNDAFIRCRRAHDDPAICLSLAQQVIDCSTSLFKRVGLSPCQALFERAWKCLDMNNHNPIYCRPEEFEFYQCTKEHLGLEKKLWKGRGPEEGLKEEGERAELASKRFAAHVWINKNSYDKENVN